jgi:hypothetical protein
MSDDEMARGLGAVVLCWIAFVAVMLFAGWAFA